MDDLKIQATMHVFPDKEQAQAFSRRVGPTTDNLGVLEKLKTSIRGADSSRDAALDGLVLSEFRVQANKLISQGSDAMVEFLSGAGYSLEELDCNNLLPIGVLREDLGQLVALLEDLVMREFRSQGESVIRRGSHFILDFLLGVGRTPEEINQAIATQRGLVTVAGIS